MSLFNEFVRSGTRKLEDHGLLLSVCTEAEVDSVAGLEEGERNALKMTIRLRGGQKSSRLLSLSYILLC